MNKISGSSLQSELVAALEAADVQSALREFAHAKARAGVSQADLLAVFQEKLVSAAENPADDTYNALADVMDFISGWCSPGVAVYPPASSSS